MSSWQGNRNGVVVGLMSLVLMMSSFSPASGVGGPASDPPKTKTATKKKVEKAVDKKPEPKKDKVTPARIEAAKKAALESIRKKSAEKTDKQRADERFKMAKELAERRRQARPAAPKGGVKTAAEKLNLQGKGYDPSKVVRVPRQTGPPPVASTQPVVVDRGRPGLPGTRPAGARTAIKVKPNEPPRPVHGVRTLPKRSASPRGGRPPVRGGAPGGKSAVGAVVPIGPAREVAADGGIVAPTMQFPTTQPDPDARAYRFDYIDTPWPDVLSDVARISGLVLVGDYKSITDTVSFRSPQDFTFTEVLHTLNNLLLDRPVDKRLVERDGIYLEVWRLPDRMKKIPPAKMYQTFEAFEAADLDPFDMALTYFEPPPGWTPFEVIDEFRTHFDDYYGTEVDGNRIQLTGLVRDHYKFRETIAALAVGPPPDADTGRTKVVRKLHVRKAAEVQQVLRQIFPIMSAPKANRPGVNPSAEQAKQTTIVPDAANNQLIIKAAPTVLAQILETIDTLDSGREVRAPVVQRIVLVNTGTATILQALKPILATQRTEMSKKAAQSYIPPDIQDAVNVDIFPDMAGNAVVLVGSAAGVAAATEMVKQWDVSGAGKDHIIELEYADAAELTATLSSIFPVGNPKAGGGGARFQPQPGNRLLVVCGDSDLERIRGLIEKLDVPPDDEASERFVHLKSARPSEIAPILEQIAGGSGSAIRRSMPAQRIIKGKRVVRRPVVRRTGGGATGPRFIPDDASSLLIVYCNDKDWDKIEPIIRRLDDEAETVEPVYHTFALTRADAADVVTMLNQMYPAPPRAKGAAMTVAHQFFADPYNNTVRVYASQPFMDEITPLIEKLDIQTQGELTIIKLEHARAEDVAVILRENFGGGGTVRRRTVVTKGKVRRPMRMSSATSTKGVVINSEPVTNSLLITAPPEKLDQIKALVADIDRESESKEPSRVILTAENRPAGEIANTLLSLTGRGARRVVKRKPGQQGASGIAGGGSLKVVPSGNRVILDGPRDEVAKAVQLFTEIDVRQQTPVFKKYAVLDAEETEAALRPMLGVAGPAGGKVKAGAKRRPASRVSRPSAIQIHANTYDNTILVGAMPEDFPRIDALLETILRDGDPVDPDMPTDMGEYWLIQLKHRKAYDIAFEVEDLLKPPGKRPGPTLEEGPTERTLLVRSKPSQREKIRELVEMFDVPDTTRDMGAYSMTLDPEEKMSPKVLAELVKAQLADRIGRKVEVVGLWDTGNVEIVDVHAGEPPAAETPVDASENIATSQPVSPCVLPASLLRAVEAVTLGQTSAGRYDDPIDPRLCPVCHQSPCVLPARLVRSLDAVATASMGQTPPGDDAPDPESARPPMTHNHPLVESDSSPAPSSESAESPTDGGGGPVDAEVAPTGPIRIITGPFGKVFVEGVTEEEQEIIDEIVSDLTSGKAPTVIRVFPLKYADVAVAAQLLNQVFNQQVPARRQPQRAVKQPQIPGAKGGAQAGGQKGRGGQPRAPRVQPSRIKVVADPRTRSLLVAAPMTDIPLIVDVLRQIDRKVPPKEQNLKIFKLENLDATQVVDNLREVLGLSGGSRRQPGRGGARGQAGRGGQQAAQQRIIQMQQGRQQQRQGTVVSSENIKLTAEAQTNSIIAQAPPDTLELIAKLIGDLEQGTNTTKKEMRRVELKFAKATEVATIVRDVAAQTTARPSGGGGRGGRGPRRGGSSSTGVSVNADARTNSVILAGQAKDLDQVEAIVTELDVDTGAGEGIRQFSVKGDAKSISSALKSVFGAGGKDSDVVISSDTSTGTVLVKAPAKEMEEIERQITEMDSKVAMSQQRQSIEVKLGDAEKIAQSLQDLFRDSRSRRGSKQNITIKGNKSSKRLYVTGADDETFEQITKIAGEMDQPPTDIQVKAFHLDHASAIDVDQKLTTMMGKAMAAGGVDFDLDLVGVVPDARTNSLIVTGGPLTFMLIGKVLKEIDVEPETPIARETKSYTLPRTVNANEVSNNIKALFAGQSFKKTGIEAPTVTANMSSNIVTVLANATQHDQIKTSIIDPILAAVGEPLKDYQVTLEYQRAEDIKPTLEDFMNKWRQSRGSKPQDAFTITADPNSNILLLNCSPSTKTVFDTQLAALDTEASKPTTRELRTYSLKYANINSVRDAITQAFRRAGRVPERDQVAVSLDSNTNSVLVLASESNHEQITQMIATMDVEGGAGATQDFLYEVKNARAVDLANTLNNIIHNSRTPTRGKYPINVIGDDATNRLVVTASQTDYESILKTIESLDVEGAAGKITKTFTVKYAEPSSIPRVINEQFRTRSRNPNDQVVASYINGTMSVIVTASSENMAKVEQLFEQADVPSSQDKITKFIKLKNARADTLSTVLNQAHRASVPRPRNGVYPITYAADMSSNTLIVTASQDEFEKIEATIAELDVEDTVGRITKTFTLKYAEPWNLPRVINEQFRNRQSRNPNDQVVASYVNGTMSIIVTANAENMSRVEALIEQADVPSADSAKETRFFKLVNARADGLARMLNEAHRAATPRPRNGVYPITYGADMNSNTLVVTASTDRFEAIAARIAELDGDEAAGRTTRSFPVKYVAGWTLASIINQQFRSGSRNPIDQVQASYEDGTMSIIVTANDKNMQEVEKLIAESDKMNTGSTKETRFFKLVNARADGLARMLNEAHHAATPRPRNGVYPITYGADMNSNTLVVTASTDRFEAIAARIAELDGDEAAGRTTRSFPVKYVAGWTLASIINQQFRSGSRNPIDQVQASYEDGTMSIIVTANDKNMQEVEKLIAESDKMNTGNVKETRFIELNNARADELARTLNEAFRAKTVRSRQGQWPVTVTADVASNNLIVTATTEMFEEINRMVTELDVGEQGEGERLRRVFKLTYADPGSVQGAISESYRQTGRSPSPRDVVACAKDWTTNSVIVTASRKNMEGIASLIEEIDKPGDAQRSQHVIEVTNTNASDVARSLQDVFNAANRGRRQRQSATIRAIQGTTKIAVYANAEELEQIEQLVRQIDIEGGRAVHTIVMPELVPAKTVADTINDLFGGGRRGRGDGVRAEYHEPTNTLLVHATESEFKKIKEQVIDVLSTEDTKFAIQDYRIHLKYAVADEVAQTLQEFFDKKSGSSSRRNLPPWMRGGSQEQQRENQVSIIAEPSSNMLLVSCTEKTKARIDDIIAEIDVDPSENNTMQMVSLKYMDAADMLDILTEYLRVSKRTPANGGRQTVPWWFNGRQTKQEDKTVLAGDMRLKAVESLNAIIVAGKPEGVADTVAKIKELDQPEDGMNRPVTIKLAHYNASELADILKQMYEDRGRQRGGRGGRGGSSYQAPTIVPVEATNSLLIKGKRSDVSLIEEMAKNLDAAIEEEGGGGVRVVRLKAGRDVEELARKIEDQINEVEENKKRVRRDYRPDKVSIGADVTSNSLLVSASKAKFEEVKELVKTLEEMGPVGGTSRQVIRLKNLSPDQARQLIEQLQQGSKGSNKGRSGRGRRRGRRSDAGWQQGRPLDRAMEGRTVRRMTVAGTLPVFFAQVALGMAVAQTPNDKKPAKPPQSFTIRKVQKKAPTTQPKKPVGKVRPAKRGAAKVPVGRRGGKRLTPEQAIRATTQPSAIGQMSAAAQQAFRKRLSNAPISVSEAGPDAVIIEANDQDMEVIQAILEMLDTALPQKTIEYIPLHNAQARELAGTLTNVFSKIEKIGDRTPRPEDKVDIIADPGTNGLYIAATKEKMTQAMELIRQNEEAAGETTKLVRTIPFKNRRVSEVGDTLRKMTTAYLRQKGLKTDAIQIEIDPPTNSIFVTAGEADLKFVEQIIKGLDAELPPAEGQKYQVGTADIMIVPLRVAEADKLGTLLNELLQKAATGDTPMKDFIRRFRLLDEHGEPLATVDLNRPIVIFGEPESNSLIIASTKKNCLIMKQVAMAFDKEPARAAIEHKVLTLVHADATEVADQLNAMLTDAESLTQRPGKSGTAFGQPDGESGYLVYKAVVKADARTNQVVVIGRPDAVKLLTELAASLDVKGLEVMPFEIVKLEYASAAALETALTDMIDKRAESLPKGTGPNAEKAEKVVIKGDPRSRSLIIAARKVRMEELKGLIHRLDVPATGLVDDIRTITLKVGNATEMADTLKTLWEQRKQEQEGTGGFKLEVPAIVADARSNSLIVAASRGDFDAIEQVVAKIEALELNPMANIYIVTLKYNSAQQLSSAFTALFQKRAQMRTVDGKTRREDEVEIQVDEVTNSLLVAASRENIEVLRQKVAELDQETGIAGQVEFFICDNIEASRVKDTIDALFGGDGVFKPGATGDSALAQKRERVTVTIDSRANMLIVSASPENMSLVRQVYTRMNSVQTPWDAAITKLITIEHGDAVRIAAQLQEHFDKLDQVRGGGGGQGGGGNSGFGITVFADERSNRIIIGGTKDGIDRAVSLTHQLDVPPGDGTSTIVVYGPLQEASVARVGDMIRNVFQERNQSRGSGPQVQNIPVTVEPDERSNTLLISASREDHALIKDVIDRLDRRSNLLEMVKLYPLQEARADRIKEILDELFQVAAGGAGGGGATVGVTVDNRTNAVLVAAPPGELENLDVLIQQLDTAEPVGTAEIGIFQCENEDASKMVDLLNEILTGAAAAGGGGGGAGQENESARPVDSLLIKYDFQDEKGRQLLMQMMQKNVRISFNERTNNVIVVAPPASLHLMEALIRKLDRIQKRAVMVKVFTLVQADATRMVDLLEAMFAQDQGSDQQRAFQQGREFEVEGGLSTTGAIPSAASQGGPTVKGTFGRPKTTFTADERTNSVIAAGWPEDIDVVADIIDQLDSRAIRDRDYVVYSLINAQAADVQSALDAYFQAEQARMDRLGDNIAPQRRMDQEVSVVAHEESNQLLISASPRFKSSVLNMVEQLDLPPPQVMIQVMIAEVTLSDRFEMGLEFALQQLRFSETALPGGNGVLQSTHFDVIGGTDLGAAGSGVGGFSFTITGEDFNFLVRALQSDSRLEVIQRPMIMCQDNQEANITIGNSVPFVRNTQVTDNGQVTSQIEYEDIGIILDVEPHINPDGWVYLRVAPEISAITDSTIDVGNGVLAPIFTNRTADTTVAVKDGETVVIGGLITTSENESETKVPFLGDLPGIGALFRSMSRTKDKTELLIALTPRIVRTVEDGRRLSIEERDKAGIITENIKQSPLFEGLQVFPESEGEIEDIETPPTVPGLPFEPARKAPRKRYGPSVPEYGPRLPADDKILTRRDGPAYGVGGAR